jgi:hypothetical protein
MRTFPCTCGNALFFASTHCLQCDKDVGLCAHCRRIAPIEINADGASQCGHCGEAVVKCQNYLAHDVCNGLVAMGAGNPEGLCDFCVLNLVIPDLSIDGNLDKWRRLEAAKRRVLYTLDELGLPFRDPENIAGDEAVPQLRFRFMADGEEPVHTGHENGAITINIREADSVERERTRVAFGEPHRTLVGHFRHELGHYIWDRLVRGARIDEYRRLFGDEREPLYGDALEHYYANGPKSNWQEQHVSAYASMHSWEDFAETFGEYSDINAVVMTATHFGIVGQNLSDFDSLLAHYRQIGLLANELNRDMGLLDLVPEVLVPAVVEKLRFVHGLRTSAQAIQPTRERHAAAVAS